MRWWRNRPIVSAYLIVLQVLPISSQRCTRHDTRQLYPTCMPESNEQILWCDQSNYTSIPDRSKMHATQAQIEVTATLFINDSCIAGIAKGDLNPFPNLQVFIAEKNMLKRIFSAAFTSNKKLKTIDLRNNFVEKVDSGAFAGLGNLTKLLLDNNRLSELARSWTKDLCALEELSLNNNDIAAIGRLAIRPLTHLRILRVQGNIISHIDDLSFRGMKLLTHLYMDGNRLSNIGENTFEGLESLEVFTLSQNRIATWPEKYGMVLSNLHTLHLGSNTIEVFTHEHVKNLSKLQNLSLDNNSLLTMPEDLLTSLERLRYLNLSSNYLKDIPKQAFMSCCYLSVLILSGNKLTTPHAEWFRHMESIEKGDAVVKMDGNPWKCDCDIISYQNFLQKLEEDRKHSNFAEKLKISCFSPKYAKNEILDSHLVEEIKYRNSDACPAITTPNTTPCTNPRCENRPPFPTEAFETIAAFSSKRFAYEIQLDTTTSDIASASLLLLGPQEEDSGVESPPVMVIVLLTIAIPAIIIILIYRHRKKAKRRQRERTTSSSSGCALLDSNEHKSGSNHMVMQSQHENKRQSVISKDRRQITTSISSTSELLPPDHLPLDTTDQRPTLSQNDDDDVFIETNFTSEYRDRTPKRVHFDPENTGLLLSREEGDGQSRGSTPQVGRTMQQTKPNPFATKT